VCVCLLRNTKETDNEIKIVIAVPFFSFKCGFLGCEKMSNKICNTAVIVIKSKTLELKKNAKIKQKNVRARNAMC